MALGQGLVAADGTRHSDGGAVGAGDQLCKTQDASGLPPGAAPSCPLPGMDKTGVALRGHEFHYATILSQPDAALASCDRCQRDRRLPETGSYRESLQGGCVSGTFFHLIAAATVTRPWRRTADHDRLCLFRVFRSGRSRTSDPQGGEPSGARPISSCSMICHRGRS
jgi:cobyrinic acid a,c-diamide synthase